MLDFLKMLLTPEFFFSIIRISAPILFATLAAIVVEKAGFCNIGLEGLMMFSALTGSLVSYYAHSWLWGLLAALAIGVLMSLMMGFFAFQLKTDITLVGIAINMMGSGGTLFLCKVITNLTEGTSMASSTGLITSNLLIPNINIPLIDKIPFLGGIISGHNLLTWVAFICCALTSMMLYKTSLGLNIRAVGENPNAASSVGVSVLKIKYIAIGFSGLMCGFGGAFMSMYYAAGWSLDMVAGRGFIALAAQAMGGGMPRRHVVLARVRLCAGAGHQVLRRRPRLKPRLPYPLCRYHHRPCDLLSRAAQPCEEAALGCRTQVRNLYV